VTGPVVGTIVKSTSDLTPKGAAGYAKAFVSGTLAALTATGFALEDGRITWLEGISIATAFVVAAAGAYFPANKVVPVVVTTPPPGTVI